MLFFPHTLSFSCILYVFQTDLISLTAAGLPAAPQVLDQSISLCPLAFFSATCTGVGAGCFCFSGDHGDACIVERVPSSLSSFQENPTISVWMGKVDNLLEGRKTDRQIETYILHNRFKV